MPHPSRRRWVMALVAAVVVAAVAVAGVSVRRWQADQAAARADRAARTAAAAFAADWQAGRLASVPWAGSTGAQVHTAYARMVKGIGSAPPRVRLGSLTRTGSTADATVRVTWALPGGGSWAYDRPVRLTGAGTGDADWSVQATSPRAGQSLFAPIAATSRLRLDRVAADRGDILAADRTPLVTERPVVDVGVQPSRMSGPPGTLAGQLAGILGVDQAGLTSSIRGAAPDAFVQVITLRRKDYEPLRRRLQPLPGVVFRERTQAIAPTREFARALLGSVGPVTGEMVTQAKGRYVDGDVAGLSGLQRRYDDRLGGRPGTSLVEVTAGGADQPRALQTQPGVPGRPITVSLDARVQQAADSALAATRGEAALVAMDVRTGRVVAVANSPASGLNRAMVGQYPPGSTFKVVSTYSLLGGGLRDTDPVPCPPTATVEGRSFKNYESEKFGTVPFRTDFAQSCNTAFVGLSPRLSDDDLSAGARALGIGQPWSLGTAAYSGSVPPTTSAVDKAASTFGQARVLVSPLAVTVATASVARGSYLAPSLVLDPAPAPVAAPVKLGPQVGTLRSLMRQVVLTGTGQVLKGVPGGPVSAKTGTAEFGAQSPPQTHAWITGWQGDLAFTVFVGEGKSGGTVAGPVAARFLTSLAR